MIASPSTRLEQELGRLITQDAEMQGAFGGTVPIFSITPETKTLPYIVYNENRLEAWDDDKKQGGEHTIAIAVISAGESEAWVKDMLYRIRLLWSRARPDLAPYRLVMIDFLLSDVVQEADGQAIRGTAQYRALTGGH